MKQKYKKFNLRILVLAPTCKLYDFMKNISIVINPRKNLRTWPVSKNRN